MKTDNQIITKEDVRHLTATLTSIKKSIPTSSHVWYLELEEEEISSLDRVAKYCIC